MLTRVRGASTCSGEHTIDMADASSRPAIVGGRLEASHPWRRPPVPARPPAPTPETASPGVARPSHGSSSLPVHRTAERERRGDDPTAAAADGGRGDVTASEGSRCRRGGGYAAAGGMASVAEHGAVDGEHTSPPHTHRGIGRKGGDSSRSRPATAIGGGAWDSEPGGSPYRRARAPSGHGAALSTRPASQAAGGDQLSDSGSAAADDNDGLLAALSASPTRDGDAPSQHALDTGDSSPRSSGFASARDVQPSPLYSSHSDEDGSPARDGAASDGSSSPERRGLTRTSGNRASVSDLLKAGVVVMDRTVSGEGGASSLSRAPSLADLMDFEISIDDLVSESVVDSAYFVEGDDDDGGSDAMMRADDGALADRSSSEALIAAISPAAPATSAQREVTAIDPRPPRRGGDGTPARSARERPRGGGVFRRGTRAKEVEQRFAMYMPRPRATASNGRSRHGRGAARRQHSARNGDEEEARREGGGHVGDGDARRRARVHGRRHRNPRTVVQSSTDRAIATSPIFGAPSAATAAHNAPTRQSRVVQPEAWSADVSRPSADTTTTGGHNGSATAVAYSLGTSAMRDPPSDASESGESQPINGVDVSMGFVRTSLASGADTDDLDFSFTATMRPHSPVPWTGADSGSGSDVDAGGSDVGGSAAERDRRVHVDVTGGVAPPDGGADAVGAVGTAAWAAGDGLRPRPPPERRAAHRGTTPSTQHGRRGTRPQSAATMHRSARRPPDSIIAGVSLRRQCRHHAMQLGEEGIDR